MEIEKQVTSLKLSKKLKELGVKQRGLFWWTNGDVDALGKASLKKYHLTDNRFLIETYIENLHIFEEGKLKFYSAYTVAELGEILHKPMRNEWIVHEAHNHGLEILLLKRGTRDVLVRTKEITEANARAKMLIYLLENKNEKI